MVEVPNQARSNNNEILSYLKFYIENKENPGFAIFLNGPWGSGKTWLIEKFKNEVGKDKFIHVSLYGVTNVDQIESQFFQQLYPKLSSKSGKTAIFLLKKSVNLWSGGNFDDINLSDFLALRTEKILIFDDLERCEIRSQALGYINQFIEHSGNKVIILGDENKTDQKFLDEKEKTIGRTFVVKPQFDEAFVALAENCSDTVGSTYTDHKSTIENVFFRANCSNLRTLKFCMTEFSRFYTFLPDKAKKNANFIQTAIGTFFSICLEIRNGKLSPFEILKIDEAFIAESFRDTNKTPGNEQQVRLHDIRSRHFGSGVDTIEPSLQLLFDYFQSGTLNPKETEMRINQSSFFIENDSPAWVKVWHLYSISDSDFDTSFREMFDRYNKYEYRGANNLRHIAGILLNLSENGVIGYKYEDIVNINKNVIDHMVKNYLIEPDFEDDRAYFDHYSYGLQYQNVNDPNFQDISSEIKKGAQNKINLKIADVATKVPFIIQNEPENFTRLFDGGNEKYKDLHLYENPFLNYINVSEFTAALIIMDTTKTRRFSILNAISERMSSIQHYPNLREEIPWLHELEKSMHESLPNLKQPTNYQFKCMLENLRNVLVKTTEVPISKI